MSQLDHLLSATDDLRRRRISWIVMGLLGTFLIWACFAPLDEVAVATGSVVPQGRVKTVQHLEGGIIDKLFVTEGDIVHEGEPLVQIDLGASASNADELRVRLDGYLITKMRLEAEAAGVPLVYPPDISTRQPNLVAGEMQTYTARQKELGSGIEVIQRQVVQKEHEVADARVRLSSAESNLALAEERLRMSADLMKDKLQAPMDHLEIQREAETIRGDMNSLRETLPGAQAALAETQEKVEEIKLKFSREAREQLDEVNINMARAQELLVSASGQETRTTIRSPITGVVKNLRSTTIGGVVRPGEAIMDIVPSEDALVIEAKLNPMDRGFVRVGQKALVKIDTYDYARYGGIKGEVISVAPDSTVPESGQPYFKVVIRTSKPYLGKEEEHLLIAPGMGATVDIHTGKKSVMRYLIKPVLKLKTEAFRER
ncbi:MAG: HlyD family type I secretion periplasmic adaptor subunit [Rhodospirillaceae bacterium]|nr:MAG: HlyD family type I secretion periplasmic adaptor subunit [Rhodospirillaceae bacterium]